MLHSLGAVQSVCHRVGLRPVPLFWKVCYVVLAQAACPILGSGGAAWWSSCSLKLVRVRLGPPQHCVSLIPDWMSVCSFSPRQQATAGMPPSAQSKNPEPAALHNTEFGVWSLGFWGEGSNNRHFAICTEQEP